MVGTSKILTVSYGTFSCTLEGFDDSFNTMKAIAEYFRGLAAEDRYFGAEPPTPDAEMLAQIAEREISRRVDAHMEDDGIVLRAAALTDESKADEAPQHTKESRSEVEAARKAAKAARKAEKKAAKAARQAEEQAQREADEKARAEEEAANAASDATAEVDSESEAIPTNTDILSSVSAATAIAAEGAPEPEVEETRDDASSSMLAAEGSAPTDETADLADVPPAEATVVPAHPDADSVAAKLQRIRAVVGKADNDPSNDATEPFLPQSESPDVADVAEIEAPVEEFVEEPIEETTSETTEDTAEDPLAELDVHEAEMEAQEDDADVAEEVAKGGADMISRVMARHAPDAEPTEGAPQETAEAEAEDDPDASEPRVKVVRMKREDFEKSMSEAKDETPDTPSEAALNLGLLDGAEDLDDYLEDSDFTEDDLDVDLDMIEDRITQDVAEGDDAVSDVAALSNISSVLADEPEAEEATASEAADEEDGTLENAFGTDEPQVDDAALDRLMSETDAQMQEPEGSRRRDAIAQLKAAVAAKEAARQVGEADDDGQDVENAFRNDLSEAVRPEGAPRPRPVVRTGTRTERPRPAPLKLVAAQRVDLSGSEKRDTPVVPRRVAARKDDATQQASGSFAEFAENMGARELPDLLEAAAAYTAFVEGADEFSRPQILRRVRAVASDGFNREDGLRSFAELLREGRFTKVRNGRFQVADDSRFNPQRQAS